MGAEDCASGRQAAPPGCLAFPGLLFHVDSGAVLSLKSPPPLLAHDSLI